MTAMDSAVQCLLVDDHALFADALCLLIEQRHPQVRLQCTHDLAQALQRLRRLPVPELVLLDLNLPDSRGVDTLLRLREAAPLARVIVLSADDHPDTVLAALDAGAAGFISKSADSQALGGALRTVLEGGVYVPSTPTPGTGREPASPPLSPRQLDVFWRLVDGLTNKVIARELGLSDSTVKTHVQAIYDKLGVATRAQAVMVAARMGWLQRR